MGKDKENTELDQGDIERQAGSSDPVLWAGGLMSCGPDDSDPKVMTGWGPTVCRDAGEEMEARMRGVPEHNIIRK